MEKEPKPIDFAAEKLKREQGPVLKLQAAIRGWLFNSDFADLLEETTDWEKMDEGESPSLVLHLTFKDEYSPNEGDLLCEIICTFLHSYMREDTQLSQFSVVHNMMNSNWAELIFTKEVVE